jgi:hypothetical protein
MAKRSLMASCALHSDSDPSTQSPELGSKPDLGGQRSGPRHTGMHVSVPCIGSVYSSLPESFRGRENILSPSPSLELNYTPTPAAQN